LHESDLMNINVGKAIRLILEERYWTDVPGVGAFKVKITPSRRDQRTNDLLPPAANFGFNKTHDEDDKVLSSYLSTRYKISAEKADKVIEIFAKKIQASLEKNKEVSIKDLGRVYIKETGRMDFEPISPLEKSVMGGLPILGSKPAKQTKKNKASTNKKTTKSTRTTAKKEAAKLAASKSEKSVKSTKKTSTAKGKKTAENKKTKTTASKKSSTRSKDAANTSKKVKGSKKTTNLATKTDAKKKTTRLKKATNTTTSATASKNPAVNKKAQEEKSVGKPSAEKQKLVPETSVELKDKKSKKSKEEKAAKKAAKKAKKKAAKKAKKKAVKKAKKKAAKEAKKAAALQSGEASKILSKATAATSTLKTEKESKTDVENISKVEAKPKRVMSSTKFSPSESIQKTSKATAASKADLSSKMEKVSPINKEMADQPKQDFTSPAKTEYTPPVNKGGDQGKNKASLTESVRKAFTPAASEFNPDAELKSSSKTVEKIPPKQPEVVPPAKNKDMAPKKVDAAKASKTEYTEPKKVLASSSSKEKLITKNLGPPDRRYYEDEKGGCGKLIFPLLLLIGLFLGIGAFFKYCAGDIAAVADNIEETVDSDDRDDDEIKTNATIDASDKEEARAALEVEQRKNNKLILLEDLVYQPDQCTIITGAFKKNKHVIKMVRKLELNGYKTYTQVNGNVTRVGIDFDCSKEDLREYIYKVRETISKNAWYLSPKVHVD